MGTTLPSYDYGTTIPESTEIFGVLGGAFIVLLIAFLLVLLAFSLVAYIFSGIGIMKMHEKLGLKNGWMAFVPVLNSYAMGKVAEQYIKENGKKSAKFSIILVIGQIISLVFAIFMVVLLGIGAVFLPTSIYTILDAVLSLLSYGISFIVSIISYIALWRIYAIFSNKNATLYLILSIFLSVVQPFLVFAIRNNEPLCVEIKVEEPVVEEISEEAEVLE